MDSIDAAKGESSVDAPARKESLPDSPSDGVGPPSDGFLHAWTSFSAGLMALGYIGLICLGCWQMMNMEGNLAAAIGVFFAAISIPLTLHEVYLHVLNYVNPLQKFYVWIVLMVPFYATYSCISLRWCNERLVQAYSVAVLYLYMAFVMYNFHRLMLAKIGKNKTEQAAKMKLHGEGVVEPGKAGRMFFLCFDALLPRWQRGEKHLDACWNGVLQ